MIQNGTGQPALIPLHVVAIPVALHDDGPPVPLKDLVRHLVIGGILQVDACRAVALEGVAAQAVVVGGIVAGRKPPKDVLVDGFREEIKPLVAVDDLVAGYVIVMAV